jgi:predicted histone-like DNA-binding protein
MIKYNLISRKNPLTKEFQWHGIAVPVTPVMLDQIAEEISSQCTLTAHDIKAVISALEEVTFKHLRNGESVRLGDLGSFHARLASKGAVSEEDFTVENFRGIKVRFVPSSKLRFELSIKNPDVRLVKAQKLS